MTKVIKFYADWCGPCKIYAKTFDKVVEEFKDSVEFINVNVEKDTSGLAAKFKVSSIPATFIVENESTLRSHVGRLSENDLKKFIKTGFLDE
jgi:thiol-disulfide isomerase/thioredoxin|tara:strand:+ start:231 stop:506 length:276 start_codon:yes stop_codon:yes gene_type:complete